VFVIVLLMRLYFCRVLMNLCLNLVFFMSVRSLVLGLWVRRKVKMFFRVVGFVLSLWCEWLSMSVWLGCLRMSSFIMLMLSVRVVLIVVIVFVGVSVVVLRCLICSSGLFFFRSEMVMVLLVMGIFRSFCCG